MFIDFPSWTHSKTGAHHEAKRVRVDGLRFYNCHYLIQRNPSIWGPDAETFNPARFLELHTQHTHNPNRDEREDGTIQQPNTQPQPQSNGSITKQGSLPHPNHISLLPPGSFRPFERGPRTCIGTNLAYMEAKIVLCTIARGFEFIKEGPEGSLTGEKIRWEERDERERDRCWWEREVWNVNRVTSVPCDGMRMRVRLRGKE